MLFIGAFLGHMGPASIFPCALCRTPKGARGDEIIGPRTLNSMVKGSESFARRTEGKNKHTVRDSVYAGSQRYPPLLQIPPENVIPSPFHAMHSLGEQLINLLEARTPDEVKPQLSEIIKSSGARRHVQTKQFTGEK